MICLHSGEEIAWTRRNGEASPLSCLLPRFAEGLYRKGRVGQDDDRRRHISRMMGDLMEQSGRFFVICFAPVLAYTTTP
jgi:hypothetical protein